MKRAHKLDGVKEIIFIDSTTSCESTGSTLTVLLTSSQAGVMIPLAVLIHQCQTKESYQKAFLLLQKSFLDCFGGLKVRYNVYSGEIRRKNFSGKPTGCRLKFYYSELMVPITQK